MKKKYDNVCFVTTIYALFLYLLHSDLDEIKNTLFIFSDTFPRVVGVRLPSHIFLKEKINKSNKLVRFFYNHPKIAWLYFKPLRWKLFWQVNKKYKLYAQDHLYFSSTIIGNHDYTLIEDSKDFFSQDNLNRRPLRHYPWVYNLLYGPAEQRCIGRNPKCVELLSTSAIVAVELSHIKNSICEIHKEWDAASKEKKDFIMKVYDLGVNDIKMLKGYDAILFTQNIYFYSVLTKEEQVNLYKKIIEKYPYYRVLIKPHPIDEIEYERYIDKIRVWRPELPVPSQLLSLVGIRFKKYITIFSTAVNDLEPGAEVDWYGTEVDEKLLKGFGSISAPEGVNLCAL